MRVGRMDNVCWIVACDPALYQSSLWESPRAPNMPRLWSYLCRFTWSRENSNLESSAKEWPMLKIMCHEARSQRTWIITWNIFSRVCEKNDSTHFERAVIVVIDRRVRGMSRHVRMGMSGMMWMIRHHAAATVMMTVAAHTLARLQSGIGSGGIAGTTGVRGWVRAGQIGGCRRTAATATSSASPVRVMRPTGPRMVRTARERGMMGVGCGMARMVGVHTSG